MHVKKTHCIMIVTLKVSKVAKIFSGVSQLTGKGSMQGCVICVRVKDGFDTLFPIDFDAIPSMILTLNWHHFKRRCPNKIYDVLLT